MTHLTEEQLIESYYAASADYTAAPDSHLQHCPECRERFRELETVLNALNDLPVPEPPPFAWHPPLAYRFRRAGPWFLIPAFAAALFAAFIAGRATKPQPAPIQLADSGRERILLVALSDHLERSEMVLLELANGDRSNSPAAQERARNLIGATRLYRQTTLYRGDRNYTDLLEELERALTGIANGQSQSSTPQADRIEQLLFKIRVTNSNLQKGTETL